jgi:hypothetical protein
MQEKMGGGEKVNKKFKVERVLLVTLHSIVCAEVW